MFKIESLIGEINNIVDKKKSESTKKSKAIDALASILVKIEPQLIREAKTKNLHFSYAEPVTKMTRGIEANAHVDEYGAIATDGSMIPINDDFYFPYFVINTGFAYIRYGSNHYFNADSTPKIYYEESDIYETFQKVKQLIKGESLTAKMLLSESIELERIIGKYNDLEIPMLAMFDGTLIQWEIKEKETNFRKEFIRQFEHVFSYASSIGIPVAGYISGTRSRDVLGTIRVYTDMFGIQYDEQINSLVFDRDIFRKLLKPGERSVLYKSKEPVLQYYSQPIYFFFLNTGSEVVRIEVPEFVATDILKLETTHAIILNQAEKGPQYPVVLREAHEQAVIHDAEKHALEDIFVELLLKNKVDFKENAKLFSKRSRQF